MLADITADLPITVAELIILFIALKLAARFPKGASAAVAFAAIAGGYALSCFVHSGSAITKRTHMKALVFAPGRFQHDVVIEDVPIPSHTEGGLLIHVRASALNPSNYKIIPARWPLVRHMRRWIVGYDAAGVVLSVGGAPECSHFNVGDAVWGAALSGSIAEFAMLRCNMAAHKPKGLSYNAAAGLGVAGLTSLVAVKDRLRVQKGDKVLVIGASGGCGHFGVEIANLLGAEVTGMASAANLKFVKERGAHHVVDYTSPEAMEALVATGAYFDKIYDTVSSFDPVDPDYVPSALPLLRPGGKYVAINGHVGDWIKGSIDLYLLRPLLGKSLLQPAGYEFFGLLAPKAESMNILTRWFDDGSLPRVVPIDKHYTLESDHSAWEAFARIKSRRAVGKIVLTFPLCVRHDGTFGHC
jgi:NADPH:quinone reductase-like Zn-dependent oxidoreductase